MTAPTSAPAVHARFPGLDAVRALGAAFVVATHVAFRTGRSNAGPFGGTLARMDSGVALFFVLSGFLLFRPWVVAAVSGGARPRTGTYLLRRAARILPAYWVVVAVGLLLLPENDGLRGPRTWLHHLTLTQVYGLGRERIGLSQTWSLCTEGAFYVLLPLLAGLVLWRRGPWPWLVLGACGLVSVLWQLAPYRLGVLDARNANQWLPGYLDWFAGGMALALAQVLLQDGRAPRRLRALEELARSPLTCWALAAGLYACAVSPVAGPTDLTGELSSEWDLVLKNLLYLGFAVLVVLPLVLGPQDQGRVRRALSGRLAQHLGLLSYGVFLWHLVLLEAVAPLFQDGLFSGPWTGMFAVTWLVSLLAAEVSYRLLEAPVLRAVRRRTGGSEGGGTSEAQTRASAARQSS